LEITVPVWNLRPGEAGEDELFQQKVTNDLVSFCCFFTHENGVDDQWVVSKHFCFHSYLRGNDPI